MTRRLFMWIEALRSVMPIFPVYSIGVTPGLGGPGSASDSPGMGLDFGTFTTIAQFSTGTTGHIAMRCEAARGTGIAALGGIAVPPGIAAAGIVDPADSAASPAGDRQ